jgi:hypothetical protein
MSANDQLLIRRKQNGKYEIRHIDVEEGDLIFRVADDIDGLDIAVEKANAYMVAEEYEGHPIEYGLHFITKSND